jgi:protein-disulfide isomerase
MDYRHRTFISLAVLILGAAACGNQRSEAKTNTKPADETAPPGVDISKLDTSEKRIFFTVANKVGSACGKAHSLIHSAKNDPACKRSVLALRYVAKLAHEGYLESEITEAIEKRYTGKPASIDVGDSPFKGDPKAVVTIVEFADFQCPHCRALQPVLDRLLEEYKGQVKVYFKNFPLRAPGHENAEQAAFAAAAAQKQGKFWALTARFWKNQDALGVPDIEKYAQESGLDVKQWRDDMKSTAIHERVNKDRSEGDKLNISGTPAVFIDGREVRDGKDFETLRAFIEEELEAHK